MNPTVNSPRQSGPILPLVSPSVESNRGLVPLQRVTVSSTSVVPNTLPNAAPENVLPSGQEKPPITSSNAAMRVFTTITATAAAVKNYYFPPAPEMKIVTARLARKAEEHKEELSNRMPDEAEIRRFEAMMKDTVESDDPEVWDKSFKQYLHLQKIDDPKTMQKMRSGQFWSGVNLGKHYVYPVVIGLGAGVIHLLPHTDDPKEAHIRAWLDLALALGAALIEPLANSYAFIAHVPSSDRIMEGTADIAATLTTTPMIKEANKTMKKAISFAKKVKSRGADASVEEVQQAVAQVKQAIVQLMKGRHEWQLRSLMNQSYFGGYGWQSIPKGVQAYVNALSMLVGMKYGPFASSLIQFGGAAGVIATLPTLAGVDKMALEHDGMHRLNMLDVSEKTDLGPEEGQEGHDPEKVNAGRMAYAKRVRTPLDVRQVQARQRLWIDMRKYAQLSANLLNSSVDIINRAPRTPLTPDEWIRYTSLDQRIGQLPALTAAETAKHKALQKSVDAATLKCTPEQLTELTKLKRVWAQSEIAIEGGAADPAAKAAELLNMPAGDLQSWAVLQDRIDFPDLKKRVVGAMAHLSEEKQEKLAEWTAAWIETREDLDKIDAMNYGEVSDRNKIKVDRILDIAEYGSPALRMMKNLTPWTEEFRTGIREIGFGRVGLPEEIIPPIALSYWYFFHGIVGGPVFPLAIGALFGVIDSGRRLLASGIESPIDQQNALEKIDNDARIERYFLLGFIGLMALLGSVASMSLANTKVGQKTGWVEKFNTLLGMSGTHLIGSLTAFFLYCRAKTRADQALGKYQQINLQGVNKENLGDLKKIIGKGLFLLAEEGWAASEGRGLVEEIKELLPHMQQMLSAMETELEARKSNGQTNTAELERQIQEMQGVIEDTEIAIKTAQLAKDFEENEVLQDPDRAPDDEVLKLAMDTPLPGTSDGKTVGDLVNENYVPQKILHEASEEAQLEIKKQLEALESETPIKEPLIKDPGNDDASEAALPPSVAESFVSGKESFETAVESLHTEVGQDEERPPSPGLEDVVLEPKGKEKELFEKAADEATWDGASIRSSKYSGSQYSQDTEDMQDDFRRLAETVLSPAEGPRTGQSTPVNEVTNEPVRRVATPTIGKTASEVSDAASVVKIEMSGALPFSENTVTEDVLRSQVSALRSRVDEILAEDEPTVMQPVVGVAPRSPEENRIKPVSARTDAEVVPSRAKVTVGASDDSQGKRDGKRSFRGTMKRLIGLQPSKTAQAGDTTIAQVQDPGVGTRARLKRLIGLRPSKSAQAGDTTRAQVQNPVVDTKASSRKKPRGVLRKPQPEQIQTRPAQAQTRPAPVQSSVSQAPVQAVGTTRAPVQDPGVSTRTSLSSSRSGRGATRAPELVQVQSFVSQAQAPTLPELNMDDIDLMAALNLPREAPETNGNGAE